MNTPTTNPNTTTEGGWPRVIVYADPENYALVARVVRKVTDPAYQWPADGITVMAFTGIHGSTVATFGVRKNKSGITVWDQSAPVSP